MAKRKHKMTGPWAAVAERCWNAMSPDQRLLWAIEVDLQHFKTYVPKDRADERERDARIELSLQKRARVAHEFGRLNAILVFNGLPAFPDTQWRWKPKG